MLRLTLATLLILAAHFSLTAFAPAPAGKAWALWPFAADSRSWLGAIGGLPQQGGSIVTSLLAGLAGLGFLAALLALFGLWVPAAWWPALVTGAAAASILLFALYLGPWSLLPAALGAVLVWGVLGAQWSVAGLR